MATFRDGAVGNTGEVHTSAKNALGMTARGTDGGEYVYLQGAASLVSGDAVTYDELGQSARSVAAAVGPVAVATVATGATEFSWFVRKGTATVNVSAAVADNAKLFLTATPGQLDDTSVAGDQVVGAIARSSSAGAGSITVQLNYPQVGVNVA